MIFEKLMKSFFVNCSRSFFQRKQKVMNIVVHLERFFNAELFRRDVIIQFNILLNNQVRRSEVLDACCPTQYYWGKKSKHKHNVLCVRRKKLEI